MIILAALPSLFTLSNSAEASDKGRTAEFDNYNSALKKERLQQLKTL